MSRKTGTGFDDTPRSLLSSTAAQSGYLNKLNSKLYSYSHHPYCCYVYIPSTTLFAHPSHPSCLYYYLLSPIYCFCTSYLFLHILLVLHILFCTFLYPITLFTLYFSFLPIYMLLCGVTFIQFLFFALSTERT